MPIVVTRDGERRRVIATATGSVSIEDLSTFALTARRGDLRTWPMLFDVREATFEMNAADLGTVIAPIISGLKVAEGDRAPVAVVVGGRTAFEFARMFETLLSTQSVAHLGVFRNIPTAEEWLESITDPRR